jgi:hypothetical protein
MTAVEIVAELNRRGVSLIVRAGRIIARPSGAVPPEIKAAAQRCKAELIALLADHAAGAAEEALTLLARLKGYTCPKAGCPSPANWPRACEAWMRLWQSWVCFRTSSRELIARGGK